MHGGVQEGTASGAVLSRLGFRLDRTTDDGTAFYVLAPRRYCEERGIEAHHRRAGR